MTTDGLIVVDLRRNGRFHVGRYSDCHVNVLVSLPQENRVRKASHRLIVSTAEPSIKYA